MADQSRRKPLTDALKRLWKRSRLARLLQKGGGVEMNPVNVIEVCKQTIAEATAIIEYTESMEKATSEITKSMFEEIRRDELGHLQKQVVALTELLDGGEPTEAEAMDEEGGEEHE